MTLCCRQLSECIMCINLFYTMRIGRGHSKQEKSEGASFVEKDEFGWSMKARRGARPKRRRWGQV